MSRAIGAVACGLVLTTVALAAAQTPAPIAPSTPTSSSDYVFRAPTGMLVFHVRPDATRDFETVMARIEQGLDVATDAVRRQQRSGWRLYRSAETATGHAVYVVVVSPAVAGADYDPVRMITELWPGEAQDLYGRLKAAVVRVERLSLLPVPGP